MPPESAAQPTGSPVAIVTGGARGIGAAIAAALRDDGLQVLTFDVLPADAATDGELHRIVDVADPVAVAAAVEAVAERYGRIDVLVNNAGILDVHAVDDVPEDVWDRVIAVNLKSVYLLSRAVIPQLRRAGGGSIVNIASVHALATVPRAAAYAASKGAVLALTRQMALDYYDENIRVNAVVVGSVDTAMSSQHGAGLAEAGVTLPARTGAVGRMAQPGEIAAVVAFLVSDKASFITGAPLIADGGMLARLI